MPNQHRPLRTSFCHVNWWFLLPAVAAPENELRPLVEHYWRLGMTDPAMLDHVREHLDLSKYGLR